MGGRFADKLWKRDIRWAMWVPTIGQIVCIPLLTLFLLWPEDHRLPFSTIEGGFPVALLWSVVASSRSTESTPFVIRCSRSS